MRKMCGDAKSGCRTRKASERGSSIAAGSSSAAQMNGLSVLGETGMTGAYEVRQQRDPDASLAGDVLPGQHWCGGRVVKAAQRLAALRRRTTASSTAKPAVDLVLMKMSCSCTGTSGTKQETRNSKRLHILAMGVGVAVLREGTHTWGKSHGRKVGRGFYGPAALCKDCNTMRASLAVIAVYWFLAAITALFALLMLSSLIRALRSRDIEITVASCAFTLEVKEVQVRNSPADRLFVTWDVLLEDRRTGRRVTQTFDKLLKADEFTTREFLEAYSPGSVKKASVDSHKQDSFDLTPAYRWLLPQVFFCGAWLFGVFAWLVHPLIEEGNPFDGVAKKILAMVGLVVVAASFGMRSSQKWPFADRKGNAPIRVPVQGFSKTRPVAQELAELKAMNVKLKNEPGILKYLGENIHFCEYEYGGKAWRTTSLYCQPPPDEPCPGRLNPANPRDVEWGSGTGIQLLGNTRKTELPSAPVTRVFQARLGRGRRPLRFQAAPRTDESLLRIHQRLIDQLTRQRPHRRRAFRGRAAADVLDHSHYNHIVRRIDPEPGAVGATPVEGVPALRGFRQGRIHHDCEVQPEADAWQAGAEDIDLDSLGEHVGPHQLDG